MKSSRIPAKKKFRLDSYDANDVGGFDGDKDQGTAKLVRLQQQLGELQELLYAEHKNRLLVILQGMDTSGKDGTIRHVFKGVNPQGVRVMSFKAPTQRELDHDYLWRVHQHTPGKGEIVIFNRSHYEDVVVTRVHGLIDKKRAALRFAHINEFERMLVEEGTTILKFFLHVDRDEQWDRLRARLDDPNKRWKFHPDDIKARSQWPAYANAYQDAIDATNTAWAPWYLVPANKKWYRNLVVSALIVDALKQLKMSYPKTGMVTL